jgi:hypothetical protein
MGVNVVDTLCIHIFCFVPGLKRQVQHERVFERLENGFDLEIISDEKLNEKMFGMESN